jgi:hypothetical protein
MSQRSGTTNIESLSIVDYCADHFWILRPLLAHLNGRSTSFLLSELHFVTLEPIKTIKIAENYNEK